MSKNSENCTILSCCIVIRYIVMRGDIYPGFVEIVTLEIVLLVIKSF
jgi:hypothetical protein